MKYHLLEIESILDDATSYIQDARSVIEEDIFGGEKPASPHDGWIEKLIEADRALEAIRTDETFKTMLADEEKQYDIDCDKADGQGY